MNPRSLACTLTILFWAPGPAAAQNEPPRGIEVTLGSPELTEMGEVIDELLARHEVVTSYATRDGIELREVVRVREDPSRLGYVWIDRRAGSELVVYIADRTAARILVRSVALETGTVDEIARETAGHIIEATVEALLAGTPIGRPRAEVEAELGVEEPASEVDTASPPPPSHTEPSAPATVVGVGVGYAVRGLADGAVLHGPTVQLSLRGQDPVRFGGRVAASFYLPTRWDADIAGAELVGGAAWIDGLLDVLLAEGVYLGLALGVGLDLHSVTPRVTAEPMLEAREPFLTVAVQLRGTLGLLIDPPDVPIAFRLDGWLAVDPTDLRFVVQTADGPQVALDPWLLQPAGRLSLIWQP